MIEPGFVFPVPYGQGKTIQVVALSLRQKIEVIRCLELVREAPNSPLQAMEALDRALQLCCPTMTEETMATIGDTEAMQIVSATLKQQQLSDEELKKSASPL